MSTTARQLGSSMVTRGFRVDVRPQYLPEHSKPEEKKYVFGYHVRIQNIGLERAKLISRHWIIVDADGDRHDVMGEGVVGNQPDLGPGEHFEYASFCPLETSWGTMEGTYRFRTETGDDFDVRVARFYLVAEDSGA